MVLSSSSWWSDPVIAGFLPLLRTGAPVFDRIGRSRAARLIVVGDEGEAEAEPASNQSVTHVPSPAPPRAPGWHVPRPGVGSVRVEPPEAEAGGRLGQDDGDALNPRQQEKHREAT